MRKIHFIHRKYNTKADTFRNGTAQVNNKLMKKNFLATKVAKKTEPRFTEWLGKQKTIKTKLLMYWGKDTKKATRFTTHGFTQPLINIIPNSELTCRSQSFTVVCYEDSVIFLSLQYC